MPWHDYFWTDGMLNHLAEHGVTQEDFEWTVNYPNSEGRSRSQPDRLMAWGYTEDGRYIACVYELLEDDMTVIPVTAYETREPRG